MPWSKSAYSVLSFQREPTAYVLPARHRHANATSADFRFMTASTTVLKADISVFPNVRLCRILRDHAR
jgi:hypothetical protein